MNSIIKEEKGFNNCNKGKCIGCGECCGSLLPVSLKDVEIMKKYIEEHNITPEPLIVYRNGEKGYNSMCCFLDQKTNRCKIYEARPKVCRLYKCDKSPKQILQNKINLHNQAYYNRIKNKRNTTIENMATFNDIFYNDPSVLIMSLFKLAKDKTSNTIEQVEYIKRLLIDGGREEVANKLKIKDENTIYLSDEE